MSDTPRTDSKEWFYPSKVEKEGVVFAEFARELECELANALENQRFGWDTAREAHKVYEKEHAALLAMTFELAEANKLIRTQHELMKNAEARGVAKAKEECAQLRKELDETASAVAEADRRAGAAERKLAESERRATEREVQRQNVAKSVWETHEKQFEELRVERDALRLCVADVSALDNMRLALEALRKEHAAMLARLIEIGELHRHGSGKVCWDATGDQLA